MTIPCKREWQPTPVFLPGVSHGQRSLAGYSPWGHKKSDTTEWLTHTPLQKELEKQAPQSPAQFFSFFQTSKFPEMLWPQGHHFSYFSEIYFLCCKSIWHIQFSWAHSVCFLPWYVFISHSVVLALSDPMDCSPPGSSVHGLLQARILEWVATPFSRGSSQPRDGTWVSCMAGRFFIVWATREDLLPWSLQ